MKQDVREILAELEKLTGNTVELVSGKKHRKVRLIIENTAQEFAIPKEFNAGCAKNNFYSSMRRRINERIGQIKARQLNLV